MHQSIATIDSPEFINLQPLDINPGLSSCEIKVLYVGANRNGSVISKEVATEMSKTLRGAPIVGYFRKDKQDFGDHGEQVTLDGDGIHFECLTQPYGFVAPDAKVWFQNFEDYDEFGNAVQREYLMTTGYLWAGQFEECKVALERGTNQSMELDENSLQGHWSENYKNGLEFFIINDATFSKLCMLGDDVEPCFEGASVTSPQVSKKFGLDDKFKTTLFSMMQDLKAIVSKGGNTMNEENIVVETPEVEAAPATEFVAETKEENTVESAPVETEFKKADDEEKKEEAPAEKESAPTDEKEAPADDSSDKKEEDKPADDTKKTDEEDDKKKKYSLADLEAKYSELEFEYNKLKNECEELRSFKNSIEDKQKDELINGFYMLSDEDKREVIDNKANYSLDEIEAKLSVICYRKKVSFAAVEPAIETEEKSAPAVTFSMNDNEESAVPGYIQALRNVRK